MLHASGLIPARFLTLLSHLVLALTMIMSRKDNVEACLPYEYDDNDFSRKDYEMYVGLVVAVVLLVIELLGFLLGASMFSPGGN